MLVDCMTKNMPPDAMMSYLKSMIYALKYDDVIKNTKREVAKQRKRIRTESSLSDAKEEETYDQYSAQHINVVDHYDLYLPMFRLLYSKTQPVNLVRQYDGDYRSLRDSFKTYKEAYCCLVETLCSK